MAGYRNRIVAVKELHLEGIALQTLLNIFLSEMEVSEQSEWPYRV